MNKFNILAFETSCDDTSVAIVNSDYEVIENLVSSQKIHNDFGGVVPELASRLHLKNILPLTEICLKKAKMSFDSIDALAVSINPGLIGSLLVGVSFAKALAFSLGKPLIPVNHMLGHVFSNKIDNKDLQPPFLALIISGGHTELVYFEDFENFTIVGRTLDDAAGEAFDKAAKLMNLGYPGGQKIDNLSKNGNPDFVKFPRALNTKNNFNFSFSGLKTSIMTYLNSQSPQQIESRLNDISASVQEAIVDSLVIKTTLYATNNRIEQILLAGGVSANSRLRTKMQDFCSKKKIKLLYPSLKYCIDNAAMIGAAAIEKFKKKQFSGLDLNAFSTKGTRYI